MDANAIAQEIVELREKLDEIDARLDANPPRKSSDLIELGERKKALETRLAELRGQLSESGVDDEDLEGRLRGGVSKFHYIPPV